MLLLQGKKKELRPLLFPNRGPNTVGLLGTATRIKSQPPRHLTPPHIHNHTHAHSLIFSNWHLLRHLSRPLGYPFFPNSFSMAIPSTSSMFLSKTLLQRWGGGGGAMRSWRQGLQLASQSLTLPHSLTVYLEGRGSVPWSFLTRSSLLLRSTSRILPREPLLCRVPLPSWQRAMGNRS